MIPFYILKIFIIHLILLTVAFILPLHTLFLKYIYIFLIKQICKVVKKIKILNFYISVGKWLVKLLKIFVQQGVI